jgi:hypothetical protein
MPQVEVDGLTINYDVQGEGEPLLLRSRTPPRTTPATRSWAPSGSIGRTWRVCRSVGGRHPPGRPPSRAGAVALAAQLLRRQR